MVRVVQKQRTTACSSKGDNNNGQQAAGAGGEGEKGNGEEGGGEVATAVTMKVWKCKGLESQLL